MQTEFLPDASLHKGPLQPMLDAGVKTVRMKHREFKRPEWYLHVDRIKNSIACHKCQSVLTEQERDYNCEMVDKLAALLQEKQHQSQLASMFLGGVVDRIHTAETELLNPVV